MEDASFLVYTFYIDAKQLFENIELLIKVELFATENPRTAEGGATNHDGIYTVGLKCLVGLVKIVNVAITYNRNMYLGVALHLANQRPVGLARVHLTACATVNGQCFNAAILQLFGQLGDDELFVVPTQAGFNCYGQLNGINHLAGNLQHFWYVLQHACASALTCHLFYRTAEVNVDQIRTGLFYDFGRLYHRLYVASVNLYAYRALSIADSQLRDGRFYIAYQRLGAYKLCIHHCGSKPLAKQSETNISHILHRCQKHRVLSKFYIAYLHFGCKVTHFF